MPRTIAASIGLMENPFRTASGFWRWVNLCEQRGVEWRSLLRLNFRAMVVKYAFKPSRFPFRQSDMAHFIVFLALPAREWISR
jgi:hypothetical protein